jgi:hypothetical protein
VVLASASCHPEPTCPCSFAVVSPWPWLIVSMVSQALQAPACHENLVKVGGYILGEFGNLIAGDPRSR